MKYGISEETIQKIQEVLARYPSVKKAILYGSRAKGNFKPGSDLDLTLIGDDLTTSDLGTITDALDDLLLPYQIDLSLYAQIDHQNLREHIQRVGVCFFEKKI